MKGDATNEGTLIRTRSHPFLRALIMAALIAGMLSSWSCARADAANDFQTWQWLTVRVWKTNDFRVVLYGDNRMAANSSRQNLHIFGPRIANRVTPNWNLGAG